MADDQQAAKPQLSAEDSLQACREGLQKAARDAERALRKLSNVLEFHGDSRKIQEQERAFAANQQTTALLELDRAEQLLKRLQPQTRSATNLDSRDGEVPADFYQPNSEKGQSVGQYNCFRAGLNTCKIACLLNNCYIVCR